ncbi:RNA-guided pseudouridylation complex pseudouridine synthase subunit Cbf5 [Halococcoides cellulosivorans]|uniref:Probable tRNA pseudouridine synthase B n=1 Tax=Halococcoides cellulosivorans TaxID=1679096 RepID=A0A2R4WZG5_9EURY|nr:RNA-guided pseudouridylation complex pseudouridine synthase subunit Cbf5 [Halococcoides cellulosivorans]AWB26914.1 RNA-guided pseudouridylation complex pseudouridine synthase subunit Cbf5 [Halococcoides cellulosivorans]
MLRAPPAERAPRDRLQFGVINLDKPPGPSAHQVVAWMRDFAGVDRAAHAGTLDPKVTGCLPILLGDAVRLARLFDDAAKSYVAVLEAHDRLPEDLQSAVASFEGEIYQKPPRKSAVKRAMRTREIHAIDVLDREDRRALLRVDCASGTYVRKLCHDLGLALGTGAHMGDLRRVAAGEFDDRDLVTMHDFVDALAAAEDGDSDPLDRIVAPAEVLLDDLPTVTIAPSAAREVAEGAPVYAPGVIDAESAGDALVVCATPAGTAVALGRLVGDPDADSGVVVELERVLV